MTGFFRRHAALLIAVALVSGSAPTLTLAQQDPTKSAPPVLVPPADTQAVPVTPTPPANTMAPPAKSTPVVTKETVDNPYGLEAILRQGDWVSLGTLAILGIMSMGSWYILIVKLWEQYKLMREGRAVRNAFWKAPSLREGATRLDKRSAMAACRTRLLRASRTYRGSSASFD